MVQRSTQYWLRLLLLVAGVALLIWVTPVTLPLLLALVLTVILLPVVNGIQDYTRKRVGVKWFPRSLAILPAFLLVALATVVIIQYIIVPFLVEFTKLLNNLPVLINQLLHVWKETQAQYALVLPPEINGLIGSTLNKIGNYSVDLAQRGIFAIVSLATTLLQLLLVPIMTFYLLKDGRILKQRMVSIFSEPIASHLDEIVNQVHHTMGGYLRGQLVLATNMFCIISVVAYIFDLPHPLVLALLAGIAEWIPIIGPIAAALPAIILAALSSGTLALQVMITYMVIQLIDGQIIMPKIMGRVIKLHPLVIITVIFIGGYLYGIIGMMTAVPITAILQIVINKLWYFNQYYKKDGAL